MKRTVTGILLFISLVLILTVYVHAGTFQTDVGDVNADGDITLRDVLVIRKYVAGVLPENDYIDMDASDIDSDASVSLKDVLLLRKSVAGIIDIQKEYGHTDNKRPVGRLTLCGKDINRYKILVPAEQSDCIKTFSSNMQIYLTSLCGVDVPIVTEEDGSPLIVIKPDVEDEYSLGKEGYVIKTEPDRVYIIGGVPRGCMYGILDFLKNYCQVDFKSNGVGYNRWKRVTVEEGIYDCWIPALEYRCVRVSGYNSGNLEGFLIPNKTNALESSTQLQSTRYGNALGRTYANAHSFAVLIESCTDEDQPCFSDDEILSECIENLLALIEQREAFGYVIGEEMNQISCSLNDNTDFCLCAQCKATYQKEESMAGALIKFVNSCACRVKEEYPEIDLFTIAYYEFRIPPKTVCPADNVIICYCWNGCNNHTFGSGECRDEAHYDINYNNNKEEKYFLGWAERTDKLYVWYYATSFIYYMAPSPNVLNIYDDFRWLHDNGAIGIFTEGSGSNTFEDVKGYLAAKMEENPMMCEEEFEDLLDGYLKNKYGAGWEYIRQYIDLQQEAGDQVGCFVNNYEMPFDTYGRQYMAEHYEEMEELFDNAYALARSDAERRAVRRTSLHMYFLCLSARYEDYYVNGTAGQKESWKNDYQNKLYKYTVQYGGSVGSSAVGSVPATNAITDSPMMMWYRLETGSRGNN